jgi:hypothetical protein
LALRCGRRRSCSENVARLPCPPRFSPSTSRLTTIAFAPSPQTISPGQRPLSWWRKLPRRRRVALVTVGVTLFLAISILLGRFLSTENVERDDILAVLRAQARGDAGGELALLSDCRDRVSCAATVRASARRLKRPGAVKILSLKSPTASSMSDATGTTRVAWTVIGRLPVVQCVRLRRSGSIFKGITVTLLSLSAPIPNEGDC